MMRGWLSPNLINATSDSRAALLMLLSCVIFSLMTAVVRHISQELPTLEVIFFRNLFGLLTIAPLFVRAGLVAHLRTSRIRLYLLRGGTGYVSMLCWFTGLSLIPLAEASALSMTSPLFATLGAILILGERIQFHRITGLVVGLVGMLVILQPGYVAISLGALLVVASAVFVTSSKLIAKSLTKTEGNTTIVAFLTLLMIPVTAIPAFLVWQTPNVEQFAMLVLIGREKACERLCGKAV